jgi:hypothetical protein
VQVTRTVAALRRGREALTSLQGQLDSILQWLARPDEGLDARAPERLAGTVRQAGDAFASLTWNPQRVPDLPR